MFVGYALEHTGDSCRMYNHETSKVHLTRDIKWLNRMYFKRARFHTAENLLTIKARKECITENHAIYDEKYENSSNQF